MCRGVTRNARGILVVRDELVALRLSIGGNGEAPTLGTALSPLTNFSARQPNVQVSRTCLHRRYWAVEFDSVRLPGFRHRA